MPKDSTKKDRPWLLPNANKNELHAGLYLVPTPIGNLGDITLRALDVLSGADVVVCEDTRVTKKLLTYFGISKPLLSYNDHSDERQRASIIEKLQDNQIVAFVSDAGTPMVSDPGYKLVREVVSLELPITALPGANAVLPALQLSGMPSDKFSFIGFLPSKKGAREQVLRDWKDNSVPLISYETAPRLISTLESIKAVLGEREIAVVREISKMFEEARRGTVSDVLEFYQQEGKPKGEIVLVVGSSEEELSDQDVEALMREVLEDMSTKDAAAHVAEQTGLSKKELYNLALEISIE